MSRLIISELFRNEPCFIESTFGIQGDPIRHVFMSGAVNLLNEITGGRRVKLLEIGSWTGSSILTWAQAIDQFCPQKGSILAVDYWDSFVTEEDLTQQTVDIYRVTHRLTETGLPYDIFLHNIQFARPSVKINHFRGKSSQVLPYLGDQQFDMIYIDGSHYRDDVTTDLQEADRLIKPGGILCGDDLELQFDQCDLEFALSQEKIDFVKDPRTGQSFHPGVTLAVRDVIGKVASYSGFWMARKTGNGYEPVSLGNRPMLMPDHFPEKMRRSIMQRLNKNKRQRGLA